MENKVKVWIARDKDGFVGGHKLKPDKMDGEWQDAGLQLLDVESWFNFDTTNIKWEDDEPTEAYITLAEPQEYPQTVKQDIDWEQRHYEIAKEIMPVIYQQEAAVTKQGQGIILKDIVNIAVAFADTLISTLKNKNK